MSQSTKITLRDNDRNILQLNRKNMPDNIVYSQQLSGYAKKEDITEKSLQTIQCYGNVDLDFSVSDRYQLTIIDNTTITISNIQQFGQFLLARIINDSGYTISFNSKQIITESGIYIIVFGYNNSMIGNPALQQ